MCEEEEEGVGFIDLWRYFIHKRRYVHESGKGAAEIPDNLLRSVDSLVFGWSN